MNNVNVLVTMGLIACAMAAVGLLRWRTSRFAGNQWLLPYPWMLKILAVVGLTLVCTGVSVTVELTQGIGKILVVILSLPAAGLLFLAAVEVFASQTSYNEYTLSRCTPWRDMVSVPFEDIVRIENARLKPQFIIHSRDGKTISVLKWLEQAEEVLGYAQEGLEADSRTARG
jgi:hypothetical protein